jgi:putative membrane protein
MERRLLRGIINPAMVAAWIFGLLMVWLGDHWREGWLHAKLALVIVMQIVHAGLSRWRRDFAKDANTHSDRFYRMVNEVPTVLLIGIVILVIVKPF